ncbi:MAG: DUF1566 domain-containing protein [Crocinitomicaceae bacterium]|nr:DUF1566 domain-containing protein [Crocinitomicaceae bacterium]
MKIKIFFSVTAAAFSLASVAQVQVDKIISLEGTDGNRMLTNLEAPVAPTDATNKAYVDAAVAASGGGSITEITDESASTMDFGAALRYCHDLNQGGHTDWKLPTLDQLTGALTDGAVTVPNNNSANYIFFRGDLFLYGSGSNDLISQFRLSDGAYYYTSYFYNPQSARVRCVR